MNVKATPLSVDEIEALYTQPMLELVFQAQSVHRRHHDPGHVQRCTLLSIKTGGCPEDCAYCPQSARHEAKLQIEELMTPSEVVEIATRAKQAGATRFCMGAAWRDAKRGRKFEQVLEMVRGVAALDMEVCTTLGMLSAEQAEALKEAGLTAYNHNLDTSREYYPEIISTRTYDERLETIKNVAQAGINVCCGGIVGLGETRRDRCSLLHTLANLDPQPESVPINMLVKAAGTPLEQAPDIDVFDLVRTIAVARILMPRSRVRLSAGRTSLSREAQALCFMAGANSIFFGDKLLTTPNPPEDADSALLDDLGLA